MATPKGQILFHGVHLDGNGQVVEPAVYAVDVPALADSTTHPGRFDVVSDFDFRLQEITHAFQGLAADAHVNLLVQVQNTNGRPWHIGGPIFLNGMSSGQSGLPRRPLMQRTIKRQTSVTVDLTEAT